MTERARSATQVKSCLRSQSWDDNRDRAAHVANELHRQTVDRAQRRFEQQLAESERELRWAVRQRRDQSSSPAEKRQATHYLQRIRANLNNDYGRLIQVYVHEHKGKMEELGTYMTQQHDNERQLEQTVTDRKVREAVEETQRQNDRIRLESIDQLIRERDAICEERLAAQKNRYNRLLDEQARRLPTYQPSISPSIPSEQMDIAELKGRLARVEYEHRELKKLVFNLHSDLTALITQQPTYRSIVNIPNFVVKP